jgi:hypothetical protein
VVLALILGTVVYDGGLDGFLLDHGLDVLMDVLVCNDWGGSGGWLGLVHGATVLGGVGLSLFVEESSHRCPCLVHFERCVKMEVGLDEEFELGMTV